MYLRSPSFFLCLVHCLLRLWSVPSDPHALPHKQYGILGNLQPAPGSKKGKNRKGRGIAAGQGATCGFGMRGQKSRSGAPTRPGFEGGQMPLYRRLPKLVGKGKGRDGYVSFLPFFFSFVSAI